MKKTTTMKRALGAVAIVAGLALTSACGGGDAERPTQDQVAKALTGESSVFGSSIPKESADCFAGVLVKSDLSDGTLNAIVEGDEDYKGSDDDKKALSGLTSKMVSECGPKS